MTFPEGDPINARGRNALYIIILFLGAAGMVAIAFRGYLMENNQTHQPAVISLHPLFCHLLPIRLMASGFHGPNNTNPYAPKPNRKTTAPGFCGRLSR
jgi:hypothetical protein